MLCCTLFLSACDNVSVSTGDGSEKITGNGQVVTQAREVKTFRAIDLEGVFNVTLMEGKTENVKVETDENIQPYILVSVEQDTLKVRMKDDIKIDKMKKINIQITFVTISSLRNAGVGELKCASQLHFKTLNVACLGVGATNLNLAADQLTIKSEVVGSLVLSGTAKTAAIEHNGLGLLQAFELKAEKMNLKVNGVGAAEVFASNELNISASGIGNVKYKGGASKKDIKVDGVGKVENVD